MPTHNLFKRAAITALLSLSVTAGFSYAETNTSSSPTASEVIDRRVQPMTSRVAFELKPILETIREHETKSPEDFSLALSQLDNMNTSRWNNTELAHYWRIKGIVSMLNESFTDANISFQTALQYRRSMFETDEQTIRNLMTHLVPANS